MNDVQAQRAAGPGHPKRYAAGHARGRVARLARSLFGGLYLVVVVLFGIGYLAAFLPPAYFWWTGLLAAALPFLSLLLLLLSPLVFWLLRGAPRLLHGLLIVLMVIRFEPLRGQLSGDEASADDLVLMTFNAPVRGPSPEALSRETLALLHEVEPDLVALQEPAIWLTGDPPRRRATPHLQSILDSMQFWVPTPRDTGWAARLEQPVLARFALHEPEQIVLPPTPGAGRPTFVTRVRFTWQGREAVLYNLHLHTVSERKPWNEEEMRPFDPRFWQPYLKRYREAYLRRAWEVRQLRRLLARESLPVIVAGDFNSTAHHWEYRQISRGLRNAFRLGGEGWGATYHAHLPLVRIDHILVSPEWDVVSAQVLDAKAYSDHRPLVVRLQWRGDG